MVVLIHEGIYKAPNTKWPGVRSLGRLFEDDQPAMVRLAAEMLTGSSNYSYAEIFGWYLANNGPLVIINLICKYQGIPNHLAPVVYSEKSKLFYEKSFIPDGYYRKKYRDLRQAAKDLKEDMLAGRASPPKLGNPGVVSKPLMTTAYPELMKLLLEDLDKNKNNG